MKSYEFIFKSIKTTFLVSVLFLLSYQIMAQQRSACPNLDFSNKDFTGWVCKTSTSSGVGNTGYSYLTWTGSTPVSGRHTIMTDIYGYDTNTCDGNPNARLALVPDGFAQSARVGNDNTMSEADAIIYQMTVDTNNALLLLHFAVVFQDAEHSVEQQPYFEIRLQDANGNLLNTSWNRYAVSCGAGIPGFQDCGSDIRWRDWTTVGVNLFSLIGQTIYPIVASADCFLGAHYGYGYFVGECRPMKINVQYCEGSSVAQLEAPEGFVSYVWRNQNGEVVGTNQKLSVLNPPDAAQYTVVITSASGNADTLSSIIKRTLITPEFTCDSLSKICYPTSVNLRQQAYASGSEISHWEWNISKISKNKGIEHVSSDSSLKYTFQDTGYYKILFTVYTENGCSDTQSVIVYSYPSFPSLNIEIDAPDVVCKYRETEIKARGADFYSWEGVKRVKQNTSIAIIDRGGKYMVKGTDTRGCYGYDTIELDDLEPTTGYTTAVACGKYISPSGKIFSKSGLYKDVIPNYLGCDSIITIDLTIKPLPDKGITLNGIVLTARQTGASYQWLDCDNNFSEIVNETGQSFTPTKNGRYALAITLNDCSDTSVCYAITTVGIATNTFNHNIIVYPNPTQGKINIDLGFSYENISVKIQSLNGQIITQKHFNNQQLLELNLDVAEGVYLLFIESKDVRAIWKIVKQQ